MKKILFVFPVLFAVLFTAPVYSQLPNMILLEEATNASCPPCAAQNPYLAQFLQDNANIVIGVSYHAWWPGSTDPMYTNDATMNKNRITYYRFDTIGVPTCVVNGAYATPTNGWYQGAPGDIDALNAAVSNAQSITSPVSMMIDRYTQNDSEQVKVTVSSTSAITNNNLRVIVVEGEHDYTNAGTNGETAFFNIARKMLPTYTGTKFSLAANASSSFLFKYKYNANWTTDQLSIIAFVQADADKSIIAAVQSVDPPANGFLGVQTKNNISGLTMSVYGVPTSPNRTIEYSLGGDKPLNITFNVIDLLGRTVLPLHTELLTSGDHTLQLQTSGLAAGAYNVIARTETSSMIVPFIIEH